MELNYSVFDPTGNITIIVESSVPVSMQPGAARFLLRLEPEAEQVAFIMSSPAGSDIAIRMSGGEFCGNATLCAAACAAIKAGIEDEAVINVSVSGAENIIPVSVKREGINIFSGSVSMPSPLSITSAEFICRGRSCSYPLVNFPGISHMIVADGGLDAESASSIIPELCRNLGVEALGIMLYSHESGCLDPFVYVAEIDSLYHEHSCASGSTAVAAYYSNNSGAPAEMSFTEPGGCLKVFSSAGSIRLYGSAALLYKRKTEYPD